VNEVPIRIKLHPDRFDQIHIFEKELFADCSVIFQPRSKIGSRVTAMSLDLRTFIADLLVRCSADRIAGRQLIFNRQKVFPSYSLDL
jgi:hypothetical protein